MEFDLDTPLLQLSPHDTFTTRDAVAGVHCFGGIGSGKTSGLARSLAMAYLQAGFGGIVCTAKPDEVGLWTEYARRAGRTSSLVLFDHTQGYNFLAHELERQGIAGSGSVIECLLAIVEASDAATGSSGKDSDQFWNQSLRMLLQYSVPLMFSAWGSISVSSVLSFVNSAATNAEKYFEPAFAASSYASQTLRKAADSPAIPLPEQELRTLLEYWCVTYPGVPEKTRGNVLISLTARLDRFQHGRLKACFCGKTTIVPEAAFGGAVIILGMPALTWKEDGIIGQCLFKFMFQRVVEARNTLPNDQRTRPCFIFADESHVFTSSYDDSFLATSRSSRACMVYLSQNLPSYFSRVAPDRRDSIEGLIGKFGSNVYFSNLCNRTNQYASQMIGRGIQWRANQSKSEGSNKNTGMNEGSGSNAGTSSGGGSSWAAPGGGSGWSKSSNSGSNSGSSENQGVNVGRGTNESRTVGGSEAMDAIIEPNEFSRLKTGGPANDNQVSAIWVKSGANFVDGFTPNALRVTFRQE